MVLDAVDANATSVQRAAGTKAGPPTSVRPGDEVEIFSKSSGQWCRGMVAGEGGGRVTVRYRANGQEMEKYALPAQLRAVQHRAVPANPFLVAPAASNVVPC